MKTTQEWLKTLEVWKECSNELMPLIAVAGYPNLLTTAIEKAYMQFLEKIQKGEVHGRN